jgi:DNA-binding MarR family transcriptional regulator
MSMLIAISKSTRALRGMKLAELGLHNGQDELLMAADLKGCTVSVIADRLAIRPSTVSKMLDRLVERGLMERRADRQDGRRTILRITDAGVLARVQVIKARQELEDDLAKSLGAALHLTVASSLVECQTHLSDRLRRLR